MIVAMNHFTVIAEDPQATLDFYVGLLGLKQGHRPDIGFPGAWLKPAQAGADAIFHLYAGDAAKEPDGSIQTMTGAIDHVSVVCQGYSAFKQRFERFNLAYRENLVPATPLWQLFVYDPNGVQLELTFHSAAEHEDTPVIPRERMYSARERWFQPTLYRQFSAQR
jgi:catechol 2,3-dioxygenase-like lactoylglutathione lyase family enzyme